MAKSYTLYEATAPVISVAGVEGGSLVDGRTYYFVVCGCTGTRNAWYNRGMGRQVSPPSNKANFTADATNKSVEITLETPSTGIGGNAQSYWLFCYTSTDSDADFNATNSAGTNQSRMIYSAPIGGGAASYTMAATEFPVTFTTIARRTGPYYMQGIPELEFDGGTWADPITPKNMWDYLDGQSKTEFMDRVGHLSKLGIERPFGYIFFLHLNSASSTNYFKIPDREICIFAHKQSLGIMGRFYSGNMQEGGGGHTGNYPWGGGVIYTLGRYAHYHSYRNLEMYNGTLLQAPPVVTSGFVASTLWSGHPQWGGDHYFYDSNYYIIYGRFSTTTLKASRVNADYSMDMGITADSTMSDVKVYGRINQYYHMSYPFTIRQLQQVGTPAQWVKTMTGYSGSGTMFMKFYDSKIAYEPILANINKWWGYYAWNVNYIGAKSQTYNGFTFNVNVVDKDGVAIEGASVILKDKDGNEIINTTTDASGDITETDVNAFFTQMEVAETEEEGPSAGYHYYNWYLANYPNLITIEDYRPFTLKITKAPYDDYEMVINPQQSDWFPEGINRTVAMIIESPNIGESFTTIIVADDLNCEISSSDLTLTISDDDLTCEVDSTALTATISEDALEGTVS